MLACPFCGAPETDRFELEGRRFVVFRCLFTPGFDPASPDEEIAQRLASEYGPQGSGYFRRSCDRLHLYVTKGPAARELGAPGPDRPV